MSPAKDWYVKKMTEDYAKTAPVRVILVGPRVHEALTEGEPDRFNPSLFGTPIFKSEVVDTWAMEAAEDRSWVPGKYRPALGDRTHPMWSCPLCHGIIPVDKCYDHMHDHAVLEMAAQFNRVAKGK